ncbi:hypothetical protein, partial [Enterobacter cloacae complex sp. CH23B]|uniref:hypothetical protein n=1 Tax=Enterobacter cloacae complex sp. CH23B TaxID=2511986 RepID=UPI0013ED93FE
MSQLNILLSKLKCVDCDGTDVKFVLCNNFAGFAQKVVLECEDCKMNGLDPKKTEAYTSKRVIHGEKKRPGFDINLRIAAAFTYLGRGYSAIEQLTMFMNMRPFTPAM